jgi:hypothetical protein
VRLLYCEIMPSPELHRTPQLGEAREPHEPVEAQERQIASPDQQALSKGLGGGPPTREEQLQQAVDDGYLNEEAASNLLFTNPDGSISLDFFIFRDTEETKDQCPE